LYVFTKHAGCEQGVEERRLKKEPPDGLHQIILES
jgi:hypothetical protein